jgi:hypothetical protein
VGPRHRSRLPARFSFTRGCYGPVSSTRGFRWFWRMLEDNGKLANGSESFSGGLVRAGGLSLAGVREGNFPMREPLSPFLLHARSSLPRRPPPTCKSAGSTPKHASFEPWSPAATPGIDQPRSASRLASCSRSPTWISRAFSKTLRNLFALSCPGQLAPAPRRPYADGRGGLSALNAQLGILCKMFRVARPCRSET